MRKPVIVTKEVLDGITHVRDSGKTNMFMAGVVISLLYDNDYDAAAEWVDTNGASYIRGISAGFVSE